MTRRAALVLALLMLAGCGGAAAGGPTTPGRNSNLITDAELTDEALSSLSVYDAIMRLRPNWLRSRGATSIGGAASQYPAVLLNGTVDQSLSSLGSIRVSDVGLLRYIDSRDATTRYGTGLVNGLIEVTLRTGR